MALKARTPSTNQLNAARDARPLSQHTECFFTEFEDDESDAEQSSLRSSNQSVDDTRRRSDTTMASDEIPTPQAESQPFEILHKPVQGPQGPHLFRGSAPSLEFTFDYALQMSPVELKNEPPPRPSTAKAHRPTRGSKRSLTPIYTNIPGLPPNLHDWSAEIVMDWMFSTGVDLGIIQSFKKNDITGSVLADMKLEDLKDLDIPSFGKRHKLWRHITALKGGQAGPSPMVTPSEDMICSADTRTTSVSPPPGTEREDGKSPITVKTRKSRKQRPRQPLDGDMADVASMSFVAIEENMPEEHKCDKGQGCEHWQKWKRRVDRSNKFNAKLKKKSLPTGPGTDGATTVQEEVIDAVSIANLIRRNRPVSESMPSVVASSDVLGPEQLPDISLHKEILQNLDHRDPQENVKHFLHLQHMSSPMDAPEAPEYDAFDEPKFEIFPPQYHLPPYAPLPRAPPAGPRMPRHSSPQAQRHASPAEHFKNLPRLSIPRASTASPSCVCRAHPTMSPQRALSPALSLTNTPIALVRASTPASEMDVPVTRPNLGPISRDTSQSVPPNMQYRDATTTSALTRSNSSLDSRRPGPILPPLREEQEHMLSPPLQMDTKVPLARHPSTCLGPAPAPASSSLDRTKVLYGDTCTRSGWMKKRRTRLLRHEWSDAHFRLTGTQLALHGDAKQTSAPKETIDVDRYTVSASSGAGNGKLSAALKAMRIKDGKGVDGTAFAFQLVPGPGAGKGTAVVGGKTHHFAVGDREDRVEWMRALMLAQAKGKGAKGWEVKLG